MKSNLLRLLLGQCPNFLEMANVARDVGATSDDLLAVLTPQETRILERVYSVGGSDQKWDEARERLTEFADNVYLVVAFLRGQEDNCRVERGEAPQWEEEYDFSRLGDGDNDETTTM